MKRTLKLTLLGLIAVLLIMVAMTSDLRQVLQNSLVWIEAQGAWGPFAFILLYILATVFFLPGSILTLGAGALFGVAFGSLYVSIASTLGATGAFLIGRHLARDWVASKVGQKRTFKAIDDAVRRGGWRIVGLTRLSPIFPFNTLNYAFGLTSVSLREYVVASWIGMMPGTILYVYVGALAGSLATMGTAPRNRTTAEWIMYVVGLIATLAITAYITRSARASLSRQVGEDV